MFKALFKFNIEIRLLSEKKAPQSFSETSFKLRSLSEKSGKDFTSKSENHREAFSVFSKRGADESGTVAHQSVRGK
jgi:hypothetical protein